MADHAKGLESLCFLCGNKLSVVYYDRLANMELVEKIVGKDLDYSNAPTNFC